MAADSESGSSRRAAGLDVVSDISTSPTSRPDFHPYCHSPT